MDCLYWNSEFLVLDFKKAWRWYVLCFNSWSIFVSSWLIRYQTNMNVFSFLVLKILSRLQNSVYVNDQIVPLWCWIYCANLRKSIVSFWSSCCPILSLKKLPVLSIVSRKSFWALIYQMKQVLDVHFFDLLFGLVCISKQPYFDMPNILLMGLDLCSSVIC